MKAERVCWDIVPNGGMLASLTSVSPEDIGDAWVAVAVPSLAEAALILSAVWQDGKIWAFIDRKRAVSARILVAAVKEFHDVLREGGAHAVYGVRDPITSVRWMEWLGATNTGETINGQEVWVWLNSRH